jgi:hypothetical protein
VPEQAGNNVYHGGVALAFMRHKPEGDPHAVLYLARKRDTQIYYDPLDHNIYSDAVRNMAPLKDDSDKKWTANFPRIPGFTFNFLSSMAEPNPYPLRQQGFWRRDHKLKINL